MLNFSRRHASWFAISLTLPLLTCGQALANGKTGAGELVKYLNPVQKKGYRNESQDREIKKKSFKVGRMPLAAAALNSELGFFAIVPPDKLADDALTAQLLANQHVNGLSVMVPWSTLEPTEDNFDWHAIDNLLAQCEKNGKKLILRVSTCGVDLPAAPGSKETVSDTPKWVFDSGIKSITFNSPDGKQHVMPLFWDKNYLAKWNNFVRELAAKYDSNPTIQSIGITGGGFNGGTQVVPNYPATVAGKDGAKDSDLISVLKHDYGMDERQLTEHWKYVADQFPKRFQNARLNFNINPPLHNRLGENALDEIADYLVYRYGERIYLTRTGISSGKHGFDDYRLLLKFHNDTLTGIQLTDNVVTDDIGKITKHALDDGISFAELPVSLVNNQDQVVQTALRTLEDHIGFELVEQQAKIADQVALGQPLKASFAFVNVGAAPAMRPERNLDKDTPTSYRILVELRDADGKPVLQNVHTPPTPTSAWKPGQVISWEEELKTVDGDKHQLPPGQYTAWMSLVDANAKRKIHFVNATSADKPSSAETVEIGKVIVSNEPAKLRTSEATGTQEQR